ncbi:unnamed protein product [Miscanthus lutarioriparius]|uniref:serine--tRNA ligase n=1 Tax=Miscanthus lutarioriparius TaxID=422564 RepID=A0A811S231_9POAL|nr:unnamed protein product [Miscanthus lutarioriparius]
MLDLNLFRTGENKDGKPPGLVRTSQLRRFASVEVVDEVIALDEEWRRLRFSLDKLQQELNATAKKIGKLKVAGKEEDEEEAKKLVEGTNEIKKRQADMEAEEQKTKSALDAKLMAIGNILHESLPVAADEANNVLLRVFGDRRMEQKLMNHVDLCVALDIVDLKRGAKAGGGRGYYLKEEGELLNNALAYFGKAFLRRRGYKLIGTPHMMTKEAMGKCAQLWSMTRSCTSSRARASTSPPRRSSLWRTTTRASSSVPTSCRSEAGSHGRDTAGIFRTHEFQKVEQFCITAPDGDASWEMHEEMIRNAEDFYAALGIAGRVVNVVSVDLNNSAAKKYDLEAWFPASGTYRELTYGQRKDGERCNRFVHTLNSTLTATQRTLCCILETHQEEGGVRVPEVLRPYMSGIDFIPFKKPLDRHGGPARSKPKRSK